METYLDRVCGWWSHIRIWNWISLSNWWCTPSVEIELCSNWTASSSSSHIGPGFGFDVQDIHVCPGSWCRIWCTQKDAVSERRWVRTAYYSRLRWIVARNGLACLVLHLMMRRMTQSHLLIDWMAQHYPLHCSMYTNSISCHCLSSFSHQFAFWVSLPAISSFAWVSLSFQMNHHCNPIHSDWIDVPNREALANWGYSLFL